MAYFNISYFSEILRKQTSMSVIFPEENNLNNIKDSNKKQKDIPVLYLLHGRGGDHTDWSRYTSIERYVKDKNIAIVMPNVHNSYYIDMKYGYDYFQLVVEELPMKVCSFLNVSSDREKNYICGVSMGGYGAFKAALTYPDRYALAGSLSGALDLNNRIRVGKEDPFIDKLFHNCFGNKLNIENSENDLFYLIEKMISEKKDIPILYQCCGFDDFLYSDNCKFYNLCTERKINLKYTENSGTHDWSYWDEEIRKFIDWLPVL